MEIFFIITLGEVMYSTNPFRGGKKFFNFQAEKLYREACDNFYLKKYDQALDLLFQTTAIDKLHTKALLMIGDIKLLQEGKECEALEAYDKAILSNPASAQAYGSKAYVLDILGRYEEAYENCEKAFEYSDKNDSDRMSSLYDQKISLLCSMKRYDEASKVLSEAVNVLNEEHANYLKSCYLQKINIKKKEKKSEKQHHLKLVF